MCFVAVGPGMEELGRQMSESVATPIVYEVEQPEEVLEVDRVVAEWPLRVASLEVLPFEEVFER
jgi:hypothetical protein